MCGTYVCVICKTPFKVCMGAEDVEDTRSRGNAGFEDHLFRAMGGLSAIRPLFYVGDKFKMLCCMWCKFLVGYEIALPISVKRQALIRELSLGNRKAYDAQPNRTVSDYAPQINDYWCKRQREGCYDEILTDGKLIESND